LIIKLKIGGKMKIACIGWGSLIWDPQILKIKGKWFKDGPLLPIEFARQSGNGRITLVIEENAEPIRTLWIIMTTTNLEEAIESLKKREGTATKHIHYQKIDSEPKTKIQEWVLQWLKEKNIDCAIWTGLPAKFKGKNNIVPTISELFDYFDSVDYEVFKSCKEYVINTPRQVDTEYRRELERKLSWKK